MLNPPCNRCGCIIAFADLYRHSPGAGSRCFRRWRRNEKTSQRQSTQRNLARALVAKALAHPTRLRLLDALQDSEHCVHELTALVTVDQSTVSRHLALLKRTGLVAARKDGVRTIYRVQAHGIRKVYRDIDSILREVSLPQSAP